MLAIENTVKGEFVSSKCLQNNYLQHLLVRPKMRTWAHQWVDSRAAGGNAK